MKTTLNILILLITFIAAIVAIGGNTWVEEADSPFSNITPRGWTALACFVLLLALGVWKEVYDHQIKIRKENESLLQVQSRRPSPKITFEQIGEDEVVFEINCDSPEAAQIEDLMFKFDIPGSFVESNIEKEKVSRCDVSHSFLCGGGKDRIWAETIHVACGTLFPQSFIRVRIKFTPTQISPRDTNGFPEGPNPLFLDLHDYTRLLYSWTHEGTQRTEKECLDLTSLPYILEDNKQLATSDLFADLDAVNKMELKRKDW